MYQLNNLCGIDVGCTNIKMVAVVDGELHTRSIPSGDAFTRKELIDSISDFYLSFKHDFSGLGIAFSGFTTDGISVTKTTLKCLYNLCVDDFSHLQCKKIKLINDANATTIAGTLECPHSKVLIGITNGTSIGSGVAINGKLFTGSTGIAGEIYGNPIFLSGPTPVKIGQICSGQKLYQNIIKISKEHKNDEILKYTANYLGCLIISLIHSFNPDIIYFSGGAFDIPDFLDLALDFVHENTYPSFLKNLSFILSSFQNYAGCIGAMKYLLDSDLT